MNDATRAVGSSAGGTSRIIVEATAGTSARGGECDQQELTSSYRLDGVPTGPRGLRRRHRLRRGALGLRRFISIDSGWGGYSDLRRSSVSIQPWDR